MAKKKDDASVSRQVDPTKMKITTTRAMHLAKTAKLDAKELLGKSLEEVNDKIKWRVPQDLLLYRRVCGKVVKHNPENDSYCPVPGATVHIEDTDCSFFGFFPVGGPFFWLYPFRCRRELITTVTTDACGRFCVNLPFWDIDRILRLRLERVCIPYIFRPSLRDIIEIFPDPPIFKEPIPRPDPPPIAKVCTKVIESVQTYFGAETAGELERATMRSEFGDSTHEYMKMLDHPMPNSPPPLTAGKDIKSQMEALEDVAKGVGLKSKEIRRLDHRRFVGPFFRCHDVIVADWMTFLDVPDITFRVTQDVDDDGVEEVIYDEGFFDVRWNSGPIPDVTLVADASAICVPICAPVEEIPCANKPEISTAGYMTLNSSHHNNTTGYGTRVNRPVALPGDYPPPPNSGMGPESAVSPYALSLNIHGCHRIGDATHYRFTHKVNDTGSHTPLTGNRWWAPRSAASPGPPIAVVPDTDGWYPILDAAILEHPSWLLFWNTRRYANGLHELILELGESVGGVITPSTASDPVRFMVDNSRPEVGFLEVRWRYADVVGPWSDANSTLLPNICPVITRDSSRPVKVFVKWQAYASHFRDATLTFHGCGGAAPVPVDTVPEDYRHWHTSELDNSHMQTNEYELPAGIDDGCYTLRIHAYSRAFNPNGFDYGPATNWFTNQGIRHRWGSKSISLVSE